MAWLENILGSDGNTGLQLVLLTLGLMLVLILIFWIFRKIVGTPASRAARNRVPRLSVSDAAVVDDKRRLVLVRRDDVEHLVMIGGPTDVVVESNVVRTQPLAIPSAAPAGSATPVAAVAPTPVEQAPVVEDTKEVESNSKLGALTGAGVAVAGAAVATAGSATDSVAAVADDVVEETKSAGMSVFDSLREKVSTDKTEEPDVSVEAEVDTMIDEAETAVTPSVEAEADVEDSITAELDNALAEVGIDIEDNSPTLDTPEGSGDIAVSEDDDDMQKLLDELAMEVKEPAQ